MSKIVISKKFQLYRSYKIFFFLAIYLSLILYPCSTLKAQLEEDYIKFHSEVIAIAPHQEYIIINGGQNKEIEIGDSVIVHRNEKEIAKARIVELSTELSMAEILSMENGGKIRESDSILILKKKKTSTEKFGYDLEKTKEIVEMEEEIQSLKEINAQLFSEIVESKKEKGSDVVRLEKKIVTLEEVKKNAQDEFNKKLYDLKTEKDKTYYQLTKQIVSLKNTQAELENQIISLEKGKTGLENDLAKELRIKSKIESELIAKVTSLESTMNELEQQKASLEQSKKDTWDELNKKIYELENEKNKIGSDLTKKLDTKSKAEIDLITKVASLESTVDKLKKQNASLEQAKKDTWDGFNKKLYELENEKNKIETNLTKELTSESKIKIDLNTKIASLESTIDKLAEQNASLEQTKKNI
ncbi:hypothetical protein KKC91_09190, partial [bacterium]|nr:hypothetical protein [bacterium]